jgi:hypothetical protein
MGRSAVAAYDDVKCFLEARVDIIQDQTVRIWKLDGAKPNLLQELTFDDPILFLDVPNLGKANSFFILTLRYDWVLLDTSGERRQQGTLQGSDQTQAPTFVSYQSGTCWVLLVAVARNALVQCIFAIDKKGRIRVKVLNYKITDIHWPTHTASITHLAVVRGNCVDYTVSGS